jgi:hypothetical protein
MSTLIATFVLLAAPQDPGATGHEDRTQHLPPGLELREEGPQRYTFACEYLATDADDAFLSKHRLSATYVRNLEDGTVAWEGARLARAAGLEDPWPEGEPVEYMNGFVYRLDAGFAMFLPNFFKGFPNELSASYAKNLVWDTHMLEQFGRGFWDHLELGVPVAPNSLEGARVPLAGMGAFKNRKIELTWVGTSEQHGEPCALIRYEAFFNRFEMHMGAATLEGLSHYWGLIWVSLVDKQIEHATLDEHVSIRQLFEGGEVRKNSVLRRGTLTKLQPR